MIAFLIATTIVAFGATGNGWTSPAPQATPLLAPLGQSVPIGDLTVKVELLRNADPVDNPDQIPVLVNERLMVIHVLLTNSAGPVYTGVVTYRLEDKNGLGPLARDIKPRRLNINQGASIHVTGLFTVDKTLVPATLLVECSSCNAGKYKAVRFVLTPN